MREMGNEYSRKRPHPKHTKKNIGGGILIAAESVKFFSINILIPHLTYNLLQAVISEMLVFAGYIVNDNSTFK